MVPRRRNETDYGRCMWVSPPEPDGLIRCWAAGSTVVTASDLVACEMHWPSLTTDTKVAICEERLVRWLQNFDIGNAVSVYDWTSSPTGRLTIASLCEGFLPPLERRPRRCGEISDNTSPGGTNFCRRVHSR